MSFQIRRFKRQSNTPWPAIGNDILNTIGFRKRDRETLMRMFTHEPHDARCKWSDANEVHVER